MRLAMPFARPLVKGFRVCGDDGAYAERSSQVGAGLAGPLSRTFFRVHRYSTRLRRELSTLPATNHSRTPDVDDYLVSLTTIAEYAIARDHADHDRADRDGDGRSGFGR